MNYWKAAREVEVSADFDEQQESELLLKESQAGDGQLDPLDRPTTGGNEMEAQGGG